jgi:hypothetical protein
MNDNITDRKVINAENKYIKLYIKRMGNYSRLQGNRIIIYEITKQKTEGCTVFVVWMFE